MYLQYFGGKISYSRRDFGKNFKIISGYQYDLNKNLRDELFKINVNVAVDNKEHILCIYSKAYTRTE